MSIFALVISATLTINFTTNPCDTFTMSDLNSVNIPSGLVMIRPINLLECHIESLAPRWRDCSCCQEPLTKLAVQMQCCDTIFHLECLRDFAGYRAQAEYEKGVQPAQFACPWCRATLDAPAAEVAAFLSETPSKAVEMAGDLDRWLSHLSKLNAEARVEFMQLIAEYQEMRGALVRATRLPAKIAKARKLCHGSPDALEASGLLYKER